MVAASISSATGPRRRRSGFCWVASLLFAASLSASSSRTGCEAFLSPAVRTTTTTTTAVPRASFVAVPKNKDANTVAVFQSSEAADVSRPSDDAKQQLSDGEDGGMTGGGGGVDSFSLAVVQQQVETTKAINRIVLINGLVVGTLAFAAGYELFHTHLEAILALWEYGLGKHGPGITKLAVTFDTMARLPGDLIHNYESLVPTNPIFYKACTSGVAYALGDFISQIYQGRNLENLDLPRSFRSGAAGFIGHGPLCHHWLLFMENYLDFDGAWWATGIKVTADLTVWSIFLNAAYSLIIGTLAGRSPKDVLEDVKVTLWPALRSAWRFWPFVHTVSFSHAVPLDLKLLWVDVMEVVWVTILSKVANEDKNAKLAEDPTAEMVCVTESHGVDPSLEIELTREEEMPAEVADLSFELPRKVWAAAWPLVAMWPVLYAGYQFEKFLGLEV